MSPGAKGESFPFVEADRLKKAVVICHRNADADAYLSAFALSDLLSRISPACKVDIAAPEGMTGLTTRLSVKFPHYIVETESEDYDLFVAVDVGDAELLKGWLAKMNASKGVKVLVDHHPFRDSGIYDHAIVDEDATSAAEVVLGIFDGLKFDVGGKTAQALLEALLFDSSHLAIAGVKGLKAAVRLVDSGADLGEARRDLRSEPEYGEVLARLKGAQRLKIYRAGSWVMASSLVGSFQAHVARSLMFMGADVAVVGGESEDETRVSLRSTQRFHEVTRVHLGTNIAEELGRTLGGHGGGHATAASFSCEIDEEEAIDKTLRLLCKKLDTELKSVD